MVCCVCDEQRLTTSYRQSADSLAARAFPRLRIPLFQKKRDLEAVRAHGHLTKVWTGHALSGATEQYAESLKRNLTLRLTEVEKVGTGLALPAPSAPRTSVSEVVQVAA